MNERARRVGKNEVLFRSVNERLEDLNEAFVDSTPMQPGDRFRIASLTKSYVATAVLVQARKRVTFGYFLRPRGICRTAYVSGNGRRWG